MLSIHQRLKNITNINICLTKVTMLFLQNFAEISQYWKRVSFKIFGLNKSYQNYSCFKINKGKRLQFLNYS